MLLYVKPINQVNREMIIFSGGDIHGWCGNEYIDNLH